MNSPNREARVTRLFGEHCDEVRQKADRMFAWIMLGQWLFAIGIAVLYSPYGWEGKTRAVHLHVPIAILLGGLLSGLPIFLAWKRPGKALTRHIVAGCQVLWSALLIHLTGGRIETHFHVFVSLAFLFAYRDWRVLVTATLIVAGDHLLRGLTFPESVYGLMNPEWWRFLEHAFWVGFENSVLVILIRNALSEMRLIAEKRADLETQSAALEEQSAELQASLRKVESAQEQVLQSGKMAAIGTLVAGLSHELNNPLAIIVGFSQSLLKRTPEDSPIRMPLQSIDRQAQRCAVLVKSLLDFSRKSPNMREQIHPRVMLDQVLLLIAPQARRKSVELTLETSNDPLSQIQACAQEIESALLNLVGNALDATPAGGTVKFGARQVRRENASWIETYVADTGTGMPPEVVAQIFDPFFTTKETGQGTGLGLAITRQIVEGHGGRIEVETAPGKGTVMRMVLPACLEKPRAMGLVA